MSTQESAVELQVAGARTVLGTALLLDHDSAERTPRRVASNALSFAVPVPLMAIGEAGNPSWGHYGAQLVGVLHSVVVQDRRLLVAGVLTEESVPAGEWACGVDLAQTVEQLLNAETMVPLEPDEREAYLTGGGRDLEVLELTTSARVVGVTMYLPSSLVRSAFPQARLVVS